MTEERIGVYICHCGSNIAATVDVHDVSTWAAEALADRGVVVARDYQFMCSSLGQELIEADIREQGLTRVVVGACSPHLHEATFRNACQRAGLNPYLCEMVSLREQVSWVHTDRAAATEKSKSMISGGVERVALHEPLEPLIVPINPATLVVGGGIAGIQAALEIADSGYPVYLVEREPSIGGHMAQFDKTFPTLDCSACILTPKMVSVGEHPNITLLTWSEVEQVDGYVGNFTATVRQKARYVNPDVCTGCGNCIEKCPVRVVDDIFEAGLGYRKAIYRPFPQAVPKYPVIDVDNCTYFQRGKCKACQLFCPTEPKSIDFTQEDEIIQLNVGNIILATGYDLFDCRRIPQYGYGRLANVFTSLEFERLCNAAGPTAGEVVLRDGITKPESVGIIHCVGSRDNKYNSYCSVICCMQSLKFAHLVKERTGAEVYNFYIDMRTPFKDYDEFYQKVLAEGVHFVRGRVAEVTDAARNPGEEGKIIIQVEDTFIGKQRRIPVDMMILSAALEPRHDSNEVAYTFGIACSANGWFIEKHPKLDPVATMTEGVFIAGCAQGPKDIPATVAQGAAAAARVLGRINQGQLALEPVRASVIEEMCSGCRICNNVCPFNAIIFHDDRMVTEINPALCQ
ncbi:MAG: CoB--CoM heterodisulfide reductase iron-sulfur subunit A family protein, partial [Anaerolineae bacterium]|nr:CoB--CoM heterodisulfide reductase iron-sulfur subunit A family protein [Anaerolineae bacterium]